MPVDSDWNNGLTENLQNKDPLVTRGIARNMQESKEHILIPLLVVVYL